MAEYIIEPGYIFENAVVCEYFRQTVLESIYLPMYFPDLFGGNVRRFARSFLVFGPPGCGKTFVTSSICNSGKLYALESKPKSKLTCYRVYASDLASIYRGDSERTIQNIFQAARQNQPSVIIVEDLNSFCRRGDGSADTLRRVKTELLVQIDSLLNSQDLTWIICVTQLPCDLPSYRRRLVKRIYMTLPDYVTRVAVIKQNLCDQHHSLTDTDIQKMAILTQGLTCSDIAVLMRETFMEPVRQIQKATHFRKILHGLLRECELLREEGDTKVSSEEGESDRFKYKVCDKDEPGAEAMNFMDIVDSDQLLLPDVTFDDFQQKLQRAKPCVTREEIQMYDKFAFDFTMWQPPARLKKKKFQSLQWWCCFVISKKFLEHNRHVTDLHTLVNTDLPLPETLRLKVLTQCAETLDLWHNEHKK